MGSKREEEERKLCTLVMNNKEISLAEASLKFPGFRFSPTSEELLCYYLKNKIQGLDSCVEIIQEVDICQNEPWDLPAKSVIWSENEWFFFTRLTKRYPNGSQSKRATNCGYWKATGKDRAVKSDSTIIGTKQTLVFHTGRAPKGKRTEWIMNEYSMSGKSQDVMVVCRLRRNSEFLINDNTKAQTVCPIEDNNNATTLSGIDQIERFDDALAMRCNSMECSYSYKYHSVELLGCNSKECSCSYNSKSIEPIGYGVDSDFNVTDKISLDSSGHQKESYCNEEDCFADILMNDIVNLDDFSFNPTSSYPEIVIGEREYETAQVTKNTSEHLPPGTANRRFKLIAKKNTLYVNSERQNVAQKWLPFGGYCESGVNSIILIILIMLFLLFQVAARCDGCYICNPPM